MFLGSAIICSPTTMSMVLSSPTLFDEIVGVGSASEVNILEIIATIVGRLATSMVTNILEISCIVQIGLDSLCF